MGKMRATPSQQRVRALNVAMARAKVDLGLRHDKAVGEWLGLAPSTFWNRQRDPYRMYGWEEAGKLARRMKFTGREVCEILGVPYAPVEE